MSSVFRHNTQQSLFCITATVNAGNSISDFLDLYLWVQIPEPKYMRSVFRKKKRVQFSGLKFWGRNLEKIQGKNQKKFKVLKFSKIVPKCPNVFWGVHFEEKIFCPVFHGVIKSFRKNQRKFKIAEMPRIVPKIVQTCFEHVLWKFFRKKIAPCSMEGRVFEKIQKKSQKNFQNSKKAQNFPKSVQTCFEHVFGQFVPTIFCPVFHGGSSLQKISKILKGPISFAKVSRQVLNKSWGDFFEKVFLPSVPWRVEPSKIFKKIKKISKFKKCF